jgi:hypothetical protein
VDYAFWIIVAGLIGLVKILSPGPTMEVYSEDGQTVESVATSSIPIGNNLTLQREPRAYHKILIELGLIQ